MAFEINTSWTSITSMVAQLWRDKDKATGGGGGGGSVPDHFVEDVFEGALLAEVIPPPAGPPTTNPDGSVTPGAVPAATLVDRKTVYTDSEGLKSLYAAVHDLREAFASSSLPGAPGPTDALSPLTEEGGEDEGPFAKKPFFGPDLRTSFDDVRALTVGTSTQRGPDGFGRPDDILRAAVGGELASVLEVVVNLRQAIFGAFGPVLTQRVGDWLDENGTGEEVPLIDVSMLQALKAIVSRLDGLDAQLESLSERVGNLEGAP